ncbi:hypothetical protein C2S52_018013 [Perilla frutescens var. hirtella]|nr:hypothetical protein C2S52_018013 [Perilla frutescens var. hirtella]
MATAKESQTCQQFTARNSSYLDHMTLPHLDKNFSLPYFPHYKCTANLAVPGQYASDLPGLNTGQQDAVGRFPNPLPQYCNTSGSPYLKDSQCALSRGIGVVDKPVGASITPHRRFLIFDQSENHTRLFFSPSFPPDDQIFATKSLVSANGSFEKAATQPDQHLLTKSTAEEKWDENHLSDGEGDMLEDTDEINALLYSDTDSDDDDDSENDEVTSTGHSPPLSLEESNDRDKSLDEVTEVASCDETRKRQRLLDGKYKKQSLESGERAMKPCSYEDDVEESSDRRNKLHDGIDSNKVKIREALKMLESIIPGLDNRDPLSIIDGAVAYLKSMKTEAESLGLSSAIPP